MSVDAYATLRTQIGRKLGDPHGDVFDADTLDEILTEAQRDFAEQTKCLLNETVLSARENIETYNFPPDYLSFIRMEDEDGAEIGAVDWQWLLDQYGEDFRATTGDPLYVYSDLDRKGQFRFYPRPATSKLETAVTGTEQFLQPVNAPLVGQCYGMTTSQGQLFLVDATYIHIFDGEVSDLGLVKSIAHGQTVNSVVGVVVVRKPVDTTYYSEDTIVWTHSTKVYKTTVAGGTTTEFGTSASAITCLCGVIGYGSSVYVTTGKFIVYTNTAGIVSTPSDVFSENVEQAGVTGYQATTQIYNYHICYIACGLDSEYTVKARSGGTIFSVDQTLSPEVIYGECNIGNDASDTGNYLYAANDGTIKAHDGTLVFSDAYEYSRIYWDGESIYVQGNSTYGYNLLKLDTDGTILTQYKLPSGSVSLTYSTAAGLNGVLYLATSTGLWSTDTDRGAVVYVDGVTFDSEEGAVIDATDDDVPIVFESEEGAVTQWFSNTAAFRLWYHRYPQADALEVTDERALVHYALWKAFDEDSELRNEVKSNLHRVEYERRVAEALGDRFRGYLTGIRKRPRIYQY